jgi:hypothetical protein
MFLWFRKLLNHLFVRFCGVTFVEGYQGICRMRTSLLKLCKIDSFAVITFHSKNDFYL